MTGKDAIDAMTANAPMITGVTTDEMTVDAPMMTYVTTD